MEYRPYIEGDSLPGRPGFECVAKDGSKTYIYLNPSDDDGVDANVFVYEGETGDPNEDNPICFIVPGNRVNDI
jgi:hypothetical protein